MDVVTESNDGDHGLKQLPASPGRPSEEVEGGETKVNGEVNGSCDEEMEVDRDHESEGETNGEQQEAQPNGNLENGDQGDQPEVQSEDQPDVQSEDLPEDQSVEQGNGEEEEEEDNVMEVDETVDDTDQPGNEEPEKSDDPVKEAEDNGEITEEDSSKADEETKAAGNEDAEEEEDEESEEITSSPTRRKDSIESLPESIQNLKRDSLEITIVKNSHDRKDKDEEKDSPEKSQDDDSCVEVTPEKAKKKKPPPQPINVTPRRSSRNLNKTKSYVDKDYIEEIDGKSDDEVEEVIPTDPLADDPKKPLQQLSPRKNTIVVSDTKRLVEIAAGSKSNKGGKKEPTLVIIDTNSILSGKGAIPISQTPHLPQMTITPAPPRSALSMLPVTVTAQGLFQKKHIQVTQLPVVPIPTPVQVPAPAPAPAPPKPAILPSLTDDMYVVEAPSFIVPYVYEKPPVTPLKDFIKELKQALKVADEKEKEDEEKEKIKIKEEPVEKKESVEVKEESAEKAVAKEIKTEAEEESQKEVSKESGTEESEEQGKQDKVQEDKEESVKEIKEKDVEEKDKEDKEKEEKEEKKEEDVKLNEVQVTKEDKPAAVEKMEVDDSSEKEKEKVKKEKSDTETEDELKSDKDKEKEGEKKKSESYFDNPLGKFFIQIGMNLVQEYVQSDLLRNQRRKKEKDGKACTPDVQQAIDSLTRTLESTKENNEPFKFDLNKCKLCNFRTESDLAMAHHLETPHMRNYVYRCNFCTLEVRSPHDILFHMEAEHNVRGRLERAAAFHQCPNCPFEDNQKGKLSRHLLSCAKKYKPDRNQEPPLDWEPPAKIPRVRGARPAGLTGVAANATYPPLAPRVPNPLLASRMVTPNSQAAVAVAAQSLLAQRGRGRPPITVNRYVSGDVRISPAQQKAALAQMRGMVFRPPGNNSQPPVLLPTPYQLAGNQLIQVDREGRSLPVAFVPHLPPSTASSQKSSSGGTAKLLQQPSISITPLPRQPSVNVTSVPNQQANKQPRVPPGQQPGQPGKQATFVICEICDGYIKDLEQLRNHMQWIHKVKIHPKMIYNRPPLNCQKCQFRFFTDQGLERHLLGSHGLVTSSMQDAANKGKDGGRCPVCGRVYQWKLLNHVSRDHNMSLKPAHLSYKCTVCTATFGMYKQFENHVYSAHSVVAKRVMDKKQPATHAGPSTSAAPADHAPLLKPLKINDEITIIPQPARAKAKPRPSH